MTDLEKVVKGLTCCLPAHDPDCHMCPYDSIDLRCRAQLRDDTLGLLKALLTNFAKDINVSCKTCQDAVSRAAVLNITAETGALETQARVKRLPSVQPAPVAGVMTFDEAELLQVCWIEIKFPASVFPAQVVKFFKDSPNATIFRFRVETRDYPLDEYGIKWRCWTSKPTDEQREAIPWL